MTDDDQSNTRAEAVKRATGVTTQQISVNHNHTMTDTEVEIICNKGLRRDIDTIIQRVRNLPPGREVSLCITKLQEAVMWLGMNLKRIREATGEGANPYPSSKDPSTTTIEPTADGLKL